MNITTITTTLTTWLNEDTEEKLQYESDTDSYYYYDSDGYLIASWETKENEDIIKLCGCGVQTVYLTGKDYIDNPQFVHFVLTHKVLAITASRHTTSTMRYELENKELGMFIDDDDTTYLRKDTNIEASWPSQYNNFILNALKLHNETNNR
jgi:hypothetical protein